MANVSSSSFQLSEIQDIHGSKRFAVSQTLETGLDPTEYAKALGDIKRAQAKTIHDRVDKNLERIAALKQLKEHTSTVGRFAQSLSHHLGANQDVPNLWKQKYPVTMNSSGQDVSSVVRITALPTTEETSFILNVSQMASADRMSSTHTFADKTAPLGLDGDLVINGQTIQITGGKGNTSNMGLGDIVLNANVLLNQDNIEMEIIETAPGAYQWQISDGTLSRPLDLTGTSKKILEGLFVPMAQNAPGVTPQEDLDLVFTYNGLEMRRSGSNTITDLKSGVTVEVKGAQTGDLTCRIDRDIPTIEQGFDGFVNAYNKLQDFATAHTAFEADGKTPKEDAMLHRSNSLKSVLLSLNTTLSSWVAGVADTKPDSLPAIGLKVGLEDDNGRKITKIDLDASLLDQLLNSDNAVDVLRVVGDYASSSHPLFRTFSLPSSGQGKDLMGQDVSVNVEKVNGTLVATFSARINDNTIIESATLNDGGLVMGTKGGIFEGLTVGVSTGLLSTLTNDKDSAHSTVNFTQGLLSHLHQETDKFLQDQYGYIDEEIKALEAKNVRDLREEERLKTQALRDEEGVRRQFERIREIESKWKECANMVSMYMEAMNGD